MNLILFESSLQQEWHNTFSDLIPTSLTPLDSVFIHFIDDNNELLNSKTSCQLNVFTGLTFLLETCFELTFTCRNDKPGEISESRTHYHIRNIILMSWGIKNGKLFFRSVKEGSSHLNSLSLCFFIISKIHDVGKPP